MLRTCLLDAMHHRLALTLCERHCCDAGTGKTQLAHALLGGSHAHVAVHPFDGATRSPTVLQGSASGIGMVLIDTPGLSPAAGAAMHNCNALKQIVRCAAHGVAPRHRGRRCARAAWCGRQPRTTVPAVVLCVQV